MRPLTIEKQNGHTRLEQPMNLFGMPNSSVCLTTNYCRETISEDL